MRSGCRFFVLLQYGALHFSQGVAAGDRCCGSGDEIVSRIADTVEFLEPDFGVLPFI